MRLHYLKCLPESFGPIYDRSKDSYIISDDRNFAVGEILVFCEPTDDPSQFSRKNAIRRVSKVVSGPWNGLEVGYSELFFECQFSPEVERSISTLISNRQYISIEEFVIILSGIQ